MRIRSYLVGLLTFLIFSGAVYAQTTAFTYQGRLTDMNVAASGTYEMQFKLFDDPVGGTQQGTTITNSSVTVANGVFKVDLDFSPATPFATGADRFLEIAVRRESDPPGFTLLTPRQQITSTPYATRSNIADNTLKLQGVAVSSAAPAPNQVLKFNSGAGQWGPGFDLDTTYTAGTGLQLSGTQFSADLSSVQARVSSSCAAGTAITGIAANGSPTCTQFATTSVGLGQFAGTTSVQLAGVMSDETGAGTLVFGTAPTLTMPTIAGATMTGSLNMNNQPISNIGASGTDFSAAGGLNLADTLSVGSGNITAGNSAALELRSNGSVVINLDEDNSGTGSSFAIETNSFSPDLLRITETGLTDVMSSSSTGGLRVGNNNGSSTAPILELFDDASLSESRFRVNRDGSTTVAGILRLGSLAVDPAGTNGQMYYNNGTNKFRCFEGGVWKDCITIPSPARPAPEQQQELEKLGQLIERQQAEIDGLRKLLCLQNPQAEICKS